MHTRLGLFLFRKINQWNTKIRQFWIDETEKPDKLLLLVKGSFVPVIVLRLEGVVAQEVRTEMKKHAPEQEIRESVGVKIFERLGF